MSAPEIIEGSPPALPGCCYVCNSADRERFVDWRIDIEFHGAFYICDECMIEAGRCLGFLLPVEAENLMARNEALEEANTALEEEISTLREYVNGVDTLSRYLDSDISSRNISVPEREELPTGTPAVAIREDGPSEQSDDKDVGELFPSISAKRTTSEFSI